MGLTANDIMKADVLSVSPDDSLWDAEHMLVMDRVGGVAVIEGDELVGVLSRTDILGEMAAERALGEIVTRWFGPKKDERALSAKVAEHLDGVKVRDVMTEDVITVASTCPVRRLARTMLERGVHRVFVTRGKQLLGIVSMTDVVRLVAEGRV